MIDVNVDLGRFRAELAAELEVLKLKAGKKVDTFSRKVFSDIVSTSPQWSQNLASNWNFSTGKPDESYTESPNKRAMRHSKSPFWLGAEPVVSQTIARMQGKPQVLWGQDVYITNATPDDKGGDLAQNIEDGRVALRPVNLVSQKVALFSYTITKHEHAVL
jgi:hypothetical protein